MAVPGCAMGHYNKLQCAQKKLVQNNHSAGGEINVRRSM